MIRSFLSRYRFDYPKVLVYMLQNTEYQAAEYIKWLWRVHDFGLVMKRRRLDMTGPARLLLAFIYGGITAEVLIGCALVAVGYFQHTAAWIVAGLTVIALYPFVLAYAVSLPLFAGDIFIIAPRRKHLIARSEQIFASHPAIKIAVAGSYGKTTVKEMLATVLAEGKRVAATPANKNVAIAHAEFASRLSGNEEILIVEYGEGRPGDVGQFCRTTHPSIGIITGLAPAHLDQYKTVEAAGQDIFTLASYLHGKHVYVSGESQSLKPFIKPGYHIYDSQGVLGWKIGSVEVSLDGTVFTMTSASGKLNLQSGLLGRHLIAPTALTVALALELGLTPQQVESGVRKLKPFEHRMQPRQLAGAWIIDDTYNGNIEGVRAGLKLLAELPAKRKIYVTPGLVEQGAEKQPVHTELGHLIAEAAPDMVVLMQNSVTKFIKSALEAKDYAGTIRLEKDPLSFYENINHFISAGDLVLMQNDWTDNYA